MIPGARRRNLSIRQRCELFLKVCEAVSHAHRKLVVHRDLKPANIFITPDNTPKLLDFGVATLLDPGEQREVTSLAMRPMTPHYASPEQVRVEAMTTSTDVYSLGAILYELLSGVRAHQLNTLSSRDVERVICEVDPPRLSESAPHLRRELQGDLDAIISMALRKEADCRYASVDELASDVRRYLGALPVLARDGDFHYRATKFLRRNRLPLAVGFLLGGRVGRGRGRGHLAGRSRGRRTAPCTRQPGPRGGESAQCGTPGGGSAEPARLRGITAP